MNTINLSNKQQTKAKIHVFFDKNPAFSGLWRSALSGAADPVSLFLENIDKNLLSVSIPVTFQQLIVILLIVENC